VQVCKRWRCLTLGSASYLGLFLLCTYGTPIADMLAHSPPIPLILDYVDKDRNITAEDESAISLALQHRDRVRRIRFLMRASNLCKFLPAIKEEFPNLEHLYIQPLSTSQCGLALPESFQAPNIRHLVLVNFPLPLGSPLLVAAAGLVTLSLQDIPSSMYLCPDELLRWLSSNPQMETLRIGFYFCGGSGHDVERQLSRMPITTHVTLPNLRRFTFEGVSAYLTALLHRIAVPLLEKLDIHFFDQFMSPAPDLAQFIIANINFRSSRVELGFCDKGVVVCAYPHDRARVYSWRVSISRGPPDWLDWPPVASCIVQLLDALGPALSTVVGLILEYGRDSVPSEWLDRTEWREILGSFGNVNTLHVPNDLIREVSRSLQAENGESPMDVLPRLKMLSYSGSRSAGDKLMPFIKARRKAGCPLTLARRE